MELIEKLLPHVCIVIAGMLLTLLIIDKFNTNMNFIDNSLTKNIMIVFMALVAVCAILLIRRQRRD